MHSRRWRGEAWRAEVSIDGPENIGQTRVVMRDVVLIYDSSKGRGAGQIGVRREEAGATRGGGLSG